MGLGHTLFPIDSKANALAVWITALEDVGVGIATPDGRLHVHVASAGTVVAPAVSSALVVENNGNVGLTFLSPNTALQQITFGDPESPGGNYIRYYHNGDLLAFAAANVEFFRMVSSFRLSIGLNADGAQAPDGSLHIFDGTAGAVTANAVAAAFIIEDNTSTGLSILTPAANVGGIYFGSPTANDRGRITYSHNTDQLTFATASVARIDITGTSIAPRTDNVLTLGATGLRWSEVFAAIGAINTSDEREKHSIDEIPGEFARYLVDKITPRSYSWNSESAYGTHYGFIAQEIQAVINTRGLVANEFAPLHYDHENDRYGLRPDQLVPFLWRAVQELSKRVTAMET